MSVTVKTNAAKWKSAIAKGADFAAAALAEQMMNDSLQIIPKQEGGGGLRDAGRIEKPTEGERALVWSNSYALYQWYGIREDGSHKVRHYTTPGTGKMWVEQARAKNGSKWDKVAQNAFSKGVGK